MWANFYRNGGWGMFPTTAFGFFLVASAVLLVLRPERRYVPLVASLSVLTVSAGILGTATGMIKTFHYVWNVEPAKQLGIAAEGCAESLNNVILAFLFVIVSGLLATAASLRAMRRKRAD